MGVPVGFARPYALLNNATAAFLNRVNDMTIRPIIAAVVATAFATTGCSFSKSSESSSDSSVSPFKIASSPLESSSDSSETKQAAYEREVRDYTAEFVHSSRGTLKSYRSRLSDLAKSHGITDWESDDSTYIAIGRGLRKADLGRPQYEAFKQSMSEGDGGKLKAIEQGYDD
jgi:hypothetical protein